jgi:hypothetical protein
LPLLSQALFILLATMYAMSEAAHVTFAFDATVAEVNETMGGSGLLPFQPTVGQHMSGVVTFTPIPLGETSGNDAKLEVAWAGETFTALTHKLTTVNNYGGPIGAPIDGLSVVCGGTADCATSSSGAFIREFSLGLGSFQDVIPAAQIMDTVETWNQFENRQLVLFLRDATDTRRVSVLASVGPMRAVPEPASAIMVLSVGSSFCFLTARTAHASS